MSEIWAGILKVYNCGSSGIMQEPPDRIDRSSTDQGLLSEAGENNS